MPISSQALYLVNPTCIVIIYIGENSMTQEEQDFIYFKENQLKSVDFSTGRLDVLVNQKGRKKRVSLDIGSLNQDGYVRVWCNGKLRMKHRLIFWLYHGYIPEEVDHFDSVRNNNGISNLLDSVRSRNCTNKSKRSYKQLTAEEVHLLCSDIAQSTFTVTELSKKYSRSRCQIKGIMSKRYWKNISDQYF